MFFWSFSSLECGISTNSSIVAPSPITTPTLLLKMPLYKLSNTSYWLLNFICTPNCYIDPCLKPSSSSHSDDDSNFKSEFATNGAMLYNGPPTCLSNSSCVSHYFINVFPTYFSFSSFCILFHFITFVTSSSHVIFAIIQVGSPRSCYNIHCKCKTWMHR
jgi:hypothetical protein